MGSHEKLLRGKGPIIWTKQQLTEWENTFCFLPATHTVENYYPKYINSNKMHKELQRLDIKKTNDSNKKRGPGLNREFSTKESPVAKDKDNVQHLQLFEKCKSSLL